MSSDFKRTFFAGGAVLLILLAAPYYLQLIGYQNVVEEPPVLYEKQVEEEHPYDVADKDVIISSDNLEINQLDEDLLHIYITTNKYNAVLNNLGGGSLLEYDLVNGGKQFKGGYDVNGTYNDSLDVGLILNNQSLCAPCAGIQQGSQHKVFSEPFQLSSITINGKPTVNKSILLSGVDSCSIVMEKQLGDLRLIKQTIFYGDTYVANHLLSVRGNTENLSALSLVWNKGIKNTEKNLSDEITAYSAGYISINKETHDLWFNPSSINDLAENSSASGPIDWVAIRNKYFIMAFVPDAATAASLSAVPYQLNTTSVVPSYSATIHAAGISALNSKIYLGPLDIDHINELNTSLDRIMNFGWFIIQPFSRGVLWMLKSMHSFGLNYGLILILFAFFVRIITGPLTKKSFESNQKMQKVQPKLQKLQEKYKKDSQRLNQEMVKLYKTEGVNPAGGCLPIMLQMPLLFSLFLVFRSTIEFRGAPFFGWISNLSQPDTVFYLPFYIPIYGDQVAFLPILLGVSMFLSQRVSMATMDPKQKPIMYIMSAFFFLIFNSFPSGLNLYYLVYNFLNYFQQKSLKKA